MKREKSTKSMTVVLQPSLYEAFEKQCNEEHRNVSEVVRELMSKYTRSNMRDVFYNTQVVSGEVANGKIEGHLSFYTLNYEPLEGTFSGSIFQLPSDIGSSPICNLGHNRIHVFDDKIKNWKPLSVIIKGKQLMIEWSSMPSETYVVARYEYEV